jgi:hypothetical protein
MQVLYRAFTKCDACGTTTDNMVNPELGYTETPAGWITVSYKQGELNLIIRDVTGQEYREFCPRCVLKPVRQLLAMVKARNEHL